MSKVVASKRVVGAYTHLRNRVGNYNLIHTITGNKNSYCVAVQWMEATVAQRKVGQEDEVVASE